MFKKYLYLASFISIFIWTLTPYKNAYAEEATSSATPVLVVTDDAEVQGTATSSAQTGSNEVATSSAVLATPTASPSASPSATPTATPSADINTGNSTSTVSVNNNLNSNEVNSTVENQTVNIEGEQQGTVDLSFADESSKLENQCTTDPTPQNVTVNISSSGELMSVVVSDANTGNNTATSSADVNLNTGDANSVVSLVNNVNTTVVNSKLYYYTINILGNFVGDIILPDLGDVKPGGNTQSAQLSNSADVTNIVNSDANTGNNEISNSSSSQITTGNATSLVNILNLINKNIINDKTVSLTINNLGDWQGLFVGWDRFSSSDNQTQIYTYSTSPTDGECDSGCAATLTATSSAKIINDITSTANTGNNTIASGSGNINTGNAKSIVTINNVVNSNFINSIGFWGTINILGKFKGNIGGISELQAYYDSQITDSESTVMQSADSGKQTGGELVLYQSNNVNDFVYPGDTVTFFLNTKNIGTGKVYDAVLRIGLVKDGVDLGGANYLIGDIDPGKGYKLTTGLVISKDADPGHYTAHAVIYGLVGPDDSEIQAYADSQFNVEAKYLPTVLGSTHSDENNNPPAVLGSNIENYPESFWHKYRGFVALSTMPFIYFLLGKLKAKLATSEGEIKLFPKIATIPFLSIVISTILALIKR